MEQTEPWRFTVIRTQGLHFMRPEKSWRPIVTIEVDKHHQHETVMGVDGQNPNLKEVFHLHQATANSQVDIRVWHRSQSKKKGKKRSLVATATHSLAELLKKQEKEPHSKLEIRLQCQTATKRSISSRGKPQNGAILHMRLRPPAYIDRSALDSSTVVSSVREDGYDSSSSSGSSQLPPSPPKTTSWHEDDDTITNSQHLRRRQPSKKKKRIRGFAIDSCDEVFSTEYECSSDEEKPFLDEGPLLEDEQDPFYDDPSAIRPHPDGVISVSTDGAAGWFVSSLLPQYTEKIETPPPLTRAERVLASFTMYGELKSATLDSHFEKVFSRLQTEWTYVGGLLVALSAVNTAVFSISPDSVFTVDSYARRAVAASSIASGLGIACDAWLLLRYNWADLHTFINRALDVYNSYFFFSLSARVPTTCMFLSAFSLMLFLGLVAFDAWPQGVLVVCFCVGVVMSLQFLVYGVHWCAGVVARGGRGVVRGGRGVVRAVRGERAVVGADGGG